MNPELKKAAALKAANELHALVKAEGRGFTAEEKTAFDGHISDVKSAQAEIDGIKAAQADADLLSSLAGEPKSERMTISDRAPEAKTLGEAFIGSAAYQGFKSAHPSGVGKGSTVNIGNVKIGTLEDLYNGRKAPITTGAANVAPLRMPTIELDRPRLSLLDLISRGQTGGSFEYLQVISVDRNAAIVAEATGAADGLKPVSGLSTRLEDAKVYTYADGYDVTNSLLSDAPALATYMDGELRYSLDNVIEEMLLNGSGTDGEPKGILNTTGVNEIAITSSIDDAMGLVKGVRKGITAVTQKGGVVSAVLLSPEDDEAIDLLQDADGRFFGGGPFSGAPGTLWGRPRVVSDRLNQGQVVLGDFKQVALLDREGLSVEAFNQHADYARRNLVYVRAELRAAQAIWRPARLAVVQVTTP
jgi:HK97 family phage major capsid protein